jgi:hypothetical protein
MAEQKSQADLDALAAQIAPGPKPNKQAEHIAAQAASVTSGNIGIAKVDPFAEVELEFRRQQLAKQAAHEERMRALEIEEKTLSIERSRAEIEDYKERRDERTIKAENKSSNYKTRGEALKANENKTKQDQKRCNHRKGGQGLQGVVGGRGDSTYFAVIKHTFCHNDQWVCCLRCGKTWKPPLERSFKEKDLFYQALAEYRMALDFPTLNAPSSSSQFQFSDNGASMREVLEPSKLR